MYVVETHSIVQIVEHLQQSAFRRLHRCCIVLSGDKQWCTKIIRGIVENNKDQSIAIVSSSKDHSKTQTDWLSSNITGDHVITIPSDQARLHLGQEYDLVNFDCFDSFSPDSLGILGGTIKAGGALILITPDFQNWGGENNTESQYIVRFQSILCGSSDVHHFRQTADLGSWQKIESSLNIESPAALAIPSGTRSYDDQEKAVEAVIKVFSGQRKRPVVLLSDRGRGKSATLGLAAKRLQRNNVVQIAVTAINRSSVDSVFKHADLQSIDSSDGLKFYPAEKLARKKHSIDMLLVDEAASIPISTLEQLLQRYSRIAFASTVHGYEGTGRGFILNFSALLDRHTRGWKVARLNSPIRWAENDPLEKILFQLLLLNAEPIAIKPSSINPEQVVQKGKVDLLDQITLARDENLLRDIFGLLSQAHYRTQPSDLKFLLDNPSVQLFRYVVNHITMGLALIIVEGDLDPVTALSVWKNKRRPKGHLIPEILCAQLGVLEATELKIARVVRIVTRPEFRRQKIASKILQHMETTFAGELDMIATSFSVTTDTLSFWSGNGFQPVRYGLSKSNHTANHSCTLVKAISAKGQNIQSKAVQQFSDNLKFQIGSFLKSLEPRIVTEICRSLNPPETLPSFSEQEFDNLLCFAFFGRSPDSVLSCLVNLALYILRQKSSGLDQTMEYLIVERVLQHKSWKKCRSINPSQGKNQGITMLRTAVRSILESHYSDRTRKRLKKYQ